MAHPTEPRLGAPGAGLPFIEGLYARYILFPRMMRTYDGAAVAETFTRESTTIIDLATGVDDAVFFTPVLIDRLPGLEDSSRYWSVAMVLEHLLLTMRAMMQITETLAAGQAMNVRISTADVKPKGGTATTKAQWIALFKQASDEVAARLSQVANQPHVASPSKDAPRVHHPFFGRIYAKGWAWVLGVHQITHRRQIQRVIDGLKG